MENKKIVFFTEMQFQGKILRTHNNMRTEFAWMCALNAVHCNINTIPSEQYDLGIIIIPKNNPSFNIENFKKYCNKIAIMQEGPNWFWQDYKLEKQIWYFNILTSVDIIYVHNNNDKKYYQGLTNHNDIRIMPSLMIEDSICNLDLVQRAGVIIGGNFVSWYGGFDSFIVAQEFDDAKVYAPSMGRKQANEEQLVIHLPYLNWHTWIHELNKYKYGIHLMRTHAAGTFTLNCAFLGIPCIGYKGLDTQEICHPNLTVDIGDLVKAKKLANKLKNDEKFYIEQSTIAKCNYKNEFSEEQFLKKVNI